MDQEERPFNPAEHRTASRVRAFLRGEIIHSNGNSRTECTVRDLSDTGARIEAPASVTIPEFFELYIPLKGLRHRSRMMWRAGNEMGVAFVLENAKPSAPAPAAPREQAAGSDIEIRMKLLELEAETARLRAQMLEMQNQISSLLRERGAA
jgi:PilZ domain